jgi:hypothetical protein
VDVVVVLNEDVELVRELTEDGIKIVGRILGKCADQQRMIDAGASTVVLECPDNSELVLAVKQALIGKRGPKKNGIVPWVTPPAGAQVAA